MAGKTEVGQLNVKLTASAEEFNKAVDAAGVKIHQLAKQGGGGFDVAGLGKTAGMFGQLATNPGAAIGGALGGSAGALGAAAGGPLGIALHAAKEAGEKLWETMNHVGEAMHSATKRAEELQISTRALAGINLLAKDRAEEAQVGLQHLERMIGEAAEGSTEARAKFAALGKDWRELAASAPDVAFGKVNDAIRDQGSAYARAASAREIYGRQGQQLLRVIEQGSKGVLAAEQKASEKGLVADPQFTHAYEQYLQAKRELDQSWTGIKNRFAATVGTPIFDFLAFTNKGVSGVFDEWFGKKMSPQDLAKKQADEAAAAAKGARAAEAAKAATEGAKIAETAKEGSKHLQAQLAALNMGATAAAVYSAQLEKGAKFTAQQRADIARQADLHEQLKRATEQSAKAKSITESVLSPTEKVGQQMSELENLFQSGKISADTYGRAWLQAAEGFHKAMTDDSPLKLLAAGSQADRSFGLKLDADRKAGNADPWKQFQEDRKRGLSLDEQRNQKLDQLLTTMNVEKHWQDRLDEMGY